MKTIKYFAEIIKELVFYVVGFFTIGVALAVILFIAGMMVCETASAEDYMFVGVATKHVTPAQNPNFRFNEQNEFVAISMNHKHVAHFINSYGVESVAVGYDQKVFNTEYVDVTLMGGVVHGYTAENFAKYNIPCADSFCPYVGARVDLPYNVSAILFGNAVMVGYTINF